MDVTIPPSGVPPVDSGSSAGVGGSETGAKLGDEKEVSSWLKKKVIALVRGNEQVGGVSQERVSGNQGRIPRFLSDFFKFQFDAKPLKNLDGNAALKRSSLAAAAESHSVVTESLGIITSPGESGKMTNSTTNGLRVRGTGFKKEVKEAETHGKGLMKEIEGMPPPIRGEGDKNAPQKTGKIRRQGS